MQIEVGSGLNLTQELTSPLGRHISLSPSCQAQGGTNARPCQARGMSGHSPIWAREFSQVGGERMGVRADPAPTMCLVSLKAGPSQVSLMKILAGKNHPDPTLQRGTSSLTSSDLAELHR